MRLAVAFGWHTLAWEELRDLVRLAEAQGYEAAYVDGDVSMLSRRRDAEVLDGWTVTTALLGETQRIAVGSIRLVHFWNAARLAQAAATAQRIWPGRLRLLISIGDRPEDPRFGLHVPPVAERIGWLDEMLDALRALWRGETVTRDGRFVRLDRARVRPAPGDAAPPIEIAARRPRMLELVARHADAWNVNLPPIPGRFASATAQLDAACARHGRDAREIARHCWIFTRAQPRADAAAALAEFRRFNPWFAPLPDAEVRDALVAGPGPDCRAQLAALAAALRIDLPVVDLCGADAATARRTLEAIPAGGAD